MSAFLVSHNHINTILSYANRKQVHVYFGHNDVLNFSHTEDLQTAAEMLLAENVASINALYPDTIAKPENMPGKMDEIGKSITFHFVNRDATAVAIVKACDCYEYQACETEEWESSRAKRVIDAIRHIAITHLPEYEDAKWEIA